MDTNELDRRFLLGGLAGVAGISALAAMSKAGPLNPPAGAVASTPGPEPRTPLSQANTPGDGNAVFVITQPGSYYLTGNLATPTGLDGIRVALPAAGPSSAGVTIDLMGFEISGGNRGVACLTSPPQMKVTVRNGYIRGTSNNGVDLRTGLATPQITALVEHVHVTATGVNGINIGGGAVRWCTVDTTGATGIAGGGPTLIESCTVIGATNGAYYASVSAEFVVRNCVAAQCQGAGAVVYDFGVVEGCAFYNVGQANSALYRAGVRAQGRAVVRNNWIEGAPVGVETTGTRALVVGNTVGNASVAPFVLSANTLYGPIVNLSSVAIPAFTGSSAPGVLTTGDPNANFVR